MRNHYETPSFRGFRLAYTSVRDYFIQRPYATNVLKPGDPQGKYNMFALILLS